MTVDTTLRASASVPLDGPVGPIEINDAFTGLTNNLAAAAMAQGIMLDWASLEVTAGNFHDHDEDGNPINMELVFTAGVESL